MEAQSLKSQIGTELSKEADGTIFASGKNGKDTFTIVTETDLKNLTARQLAAGESQSARLCAELTSGAAAGEFIQRVESVERPCFAAHTPYCTPYAVTTECENQPHQDTSSSSCYQNYSSSTNKTTPHAPDTIRGAALTQN